MADCSIDGCGRPHDARGLCATHYSRWRRTGDVGTVELLKSPRGVPCSVSGCGHQAERRGLCQTHYYRKRFRGSFVLACLYCRADMTNRPRARKFCSKAHAAMYRRHGGVRAIARACVRCGAEINLTATGRAGRTRRADTKICEACRRARSGTRHGVSVPAIVAANGGSTDCGICGDPVDLSLKSPHPGSPSIDHIVPYAHGGSNELDNLQLAHLRCNHVKSDRVA